MKKIRQALEIIVNLISDVLFKKKLIIFLGKKGIKISAYRKQKLVDNIFIDYESLDMFVSYQEFLKKHKNFQISILLDINECEQKHEFMPMLQSIIKFNPVEKFIEENYQSEDIVAYNIYNIDDKNGEIWEAIITTCPYLETINKLIEYIAYNSFQFNGIFFLSLEFGPVIETIINRKKLYNHHNDLQIFVTITQSSSIRFAAKHKKNILEESTVEFPFDKSDLYLVGTIEQAISDIILKYKAYVKTLELNICLIFLCDPSLCELLMQSVMFQKHDIIQYNGLENIYENHFQDNQLLELVVTSKKFLALNKSLKSIMQLTKINQIIFKPLMLIMLFVITFLIISKYQSLVIQKETNTLNNKYYALSEKYRGLKKRHPDIDNITNLADLYNYETILNLSSSEPFELIKSVFLGQNVNIEITEINWYALALNSIDKKTLLTLDIIYTNKTKDLKLIEKDLKAYVNDIETHFPGYQINYETNEEEITELSKKLILPVKITISRKEQ